MAIDMTAKDRTSMLKTLNECWQKTFDAIFDAREKLDRAYKANASADDIAVLREEIEGLEKRLTRIERQQAGL